MPSKATSSPSSRATERVMVFIDGSNLYHVLGQICGRHDLQFDKFGQKLANGRDLRRVYYYNIKQDSDRHPDARTEQDRFLQSLYDTPYLEVKLGIWKQRGEAMVEKGVDVMLATDLVTRAYKDQYDTAIIVSGDGDFFPAIQAVKDVGKHVEVAAFEANISPEAARVADIQLKLTKTFFTNLWMTRTQARERAAATSRPEVSDEASSPNGEDKAVTSSRRRATVSKRPISDSAPATKTRTTRGTRRTTRRPSEMDRPASDAPARETAAAQPADQAGARQAEPRPEPEADRSGMRRTPTRRRVGGNSSTSRNGADHTEGAPERALPRPPALRNVAGTAVVTPPAEGGTAQPGNESASGTGVDSAGRRQGWLRRFGLNGGEEGPEERPE